MTYENVCPACGKVREMRQKTAKICKSCARERTWDGERLAALHDLLHRTRTVVAGLQALCVGPGPHAIHALALTRLELDVATLANDVMVAQLTVIEKGVAA